MIIAAFASVSAIQAPRNLVSGYVLHDFARIDGDWINPLLDAIADNIGLLADSKDNSFANRLHRTGEAEKPKPAAKPVDAGAGSVAPSQSGQPSDSKGRPPSGPFAGLKRLFGQDG